MDMINILFVCTGNTCRSSMAEGIFKAALEKDAQLKDHVRIASAGISACDGDSASRNSVAVLMEDWGIDIRPHKARKLSKNDVESADLILTMTRSHRDAVASLFPEAAGRVYTLKEFTAGNKQDRKIEAYNYSLDITDPFGMPVEVYRRCAREIKDAVDAILLRLKRGDLFS